MKPPRKCFDLISECMESSASCLVTKRFLPLHWLRRMWRLLAIDSAEDVVENIFNVAGGFFNDAYGIRFLPVVCYTTQSDDICCHSDRSGDGSNRKLCQTAKKIP